MTFSDLLASLNRVTPCWRHGKAQPLTMSKSTDHSEAKFYTLTMSKLRGWTEARLGQIDPLNIIVSIIISLVVVSPILIPSILIGLPLLGVAFLFLIPPLTMGLPYIIPIVLILGGSFINIVLLIIVFVIVSGLLGMIFRTIRSEGNRS